MFAIRCSEPCLSSTSREGHALRQWCNKHCRRRRRYIHFTSTQLDAIDRSTNENDSHSHMSMATYHRLNASHSLFSISISLIWASTHLLREMAIDSPTARYINGKSIFHHSHPLFHLLSPDLGLYCPPSSPFVHIYICACQMPVSQKCNINFLRKVIFRSSFSLSAIKEFRQKLPSCCCSCREKLPENRPLKLSLHIVARVPICVFAAYLRILHTHTRAPAAAANETYFASRA